MYISTKLAIAALATIAGVGIPMGYFASRDHDVRRIDETPVPPVVAPGDTSAPAVRPRPAPPPSPDDDNPPPRGLDRPPSGLADPVEPSATVSDFPPPTEAPPPSAAPPTNQPAQPRAIDRPPQVPCGLVGCAAGEVCCNASCGICTPPGGTCTNKICGRPEVPLSELCGPNTCNVGQVCCNASCGICTAPGETCSQRTCNGPTIPFSVSCGMNTCNVGQVCCNPSCGICAAPGASCDQRVCWH